MVARANLRGATPRPGVYSPPPTCGHHLAPLSAYSLGEDPHEAPAAGTQQARSALASLSFTHALTTTCLNRQEVCSHRFRPQHQPISRHPQLRLRPLRHRNYPLLRAFRAQKTRSESEQPIARNACIFGVLTLAPIFSVLPTFCIAEAAILRPFVRQRHAWKALILPYNSLSPRQGIAFRNLRELLHICGTLVLVWP